MRSLAVVSVLVACSWNPALGRYQRGLISEAEEIELGQRTDHRLRDRIPVYSEVSAVSSLVERVGKRISAATERTALPWRFAVLDDAGINAFALPGGFVYVTRGLIVHLQNEAELAAVLGHEAGHVTARHGAEELRKMQAARRSVGFFRIFDPDLRHVGAVAAQTAGLTLLRHSREDELEADALGVRYLRTAGFEVGAAASVIELLIEVTQGQARASPAMLSTHPQPQARWVHLGPQIRALPRPEPNEQFIRSLDGVLYGADPRRGLLVARQYIHIHDRFTLDVPADWRASTERDGLFALAPDEHAALLVSFVDEGDPKRAYESFFARTQARAGDTWHGTIGGFAAVSAGFATVLDGTAFAGLIGFVRIDTARVVAILGMAPHSRWHPHARTVADALKTVRPLTDSRWLEFAPLRLKVAGLERETSLAEWVERAPNIIDAATLARLNRVDVNARLPAGTVLKWVEPRGL